MALSRLFDPAIDTIEEVVAIRQKAKQLLAEGKTIMEWTAEGTSVRKQFALPVQEVLEQTKLFLREADPDTYGYPVTRTKPIFL